ncbi:aTP-dependent zinc metalloprotease FtsH 1 [Clostridium sp. CAG:508]|nr:aTP-dependent zinc metalloprotease FtsH 1 [Clostridium sp. CAG:508]
MKNSIKTLAMWLIIGIILVVLISSIVENRDNKLAYSELISKIEAGEVKEITLSSDGVKAEVKLKNENFTKEVNIPSVENLMNSLNDSMKAGTVKVTEKSESIWMVIFSLLTPFGILIIFFIFWFLLMGGAQSGNGGASGKTMSFGKSRARMINPSDKNRVTFDDVAGVDEEKEELEEIVEFLKNPRKFTEMGARIPKGVLLVGHPGTGKTLLAKAVAGEAGVPFFFISGSDFVEMFVGVGASRVRDLFEEAKKKAPCIIFIDEIDAVGRQRGAGLGGGHDEREQTLNQLLVEMDGFSANEGVIVLAATNRPDILDKALLRPGRFDRQIVVSNPDVKAREQILEVHSRKKKLADDVDLKTIAKNTSGFSGADLENVLNEAALLAARRNLNEIGMQEVEDAMVKVTMGPEKRTRVRSEKEQKLVAFHEAGHAVVSRFLPTQDPVHQISIVPRGMAGGYTMYRPTEDKSFMSRTEMVENIVSLLGGRVAEQLVLNDISTGASNDIERATQIARSMVTKYGMSERIGTITLGSSQEEVFLGRDFAQAKEYSEETANLIDEEVKSIIDFAYKKAEEILKANMEKLTKVANVLLEKEKIDGDEFDEIFSE